MYYAKARFYSADDKRFVAMDPIKGNITNPLSLVPYVYCVDNPLRWVDPLGLIMTNPGNTNLELTDMGGGGVIPRTPRATWDFGSVPTLNPNWDGHIGRQLGNIVNEIASAIGDVTKHITDEDRQNDLVRGMIASVILASGESGAIVLQGIINAEKKLFPLLPDFDFYKEYLTAGNAFDAYALSISMYADSYYAGKMIGDLVMAGYGLDMTVKGAIETVGGILGTGGGITLSGTGVGALLGAGISAISVATVAAGVAEGITGAAVAATAADNFGRDKDKFEYYKKLACKEFQEKWDALLDNTTKRNDTGGGTHMRVRNDSHGFDTAWEDFQSLNLENVRSKVNSNGKTVYLGETPDGTTINLHISSTEGFWTIQYKNWEIRYY